MRHPDAAWQHHVQRCFLQDFDAMLHAAMHAISCSDNPGDADHAMQWQQQRMQALQASLAGLGPLAAQMQGSVAASLANEAHAMLLQCSTSVETDQALLQLLQNEEALQAAVVIGTAVPAAAAAAAATDRAAQDAAAPDPQQQLQLQQFVQLQKEAIAALLLLHALAGASGMQRVADRASSSSSSFSLTGTLTVALAMAGAAAVKKVASLLQSDGQALTMQQLLQHVTAGQQQQEVLLPQLLLHAQQRQLTSCAAVAVAVALLQGHEVTRARLVAAVAARLQHKHLLVMAGELMRCVRLEAAALAPEFR
jgi:hypothetical protein